MKTKKAELFFHPKDIVGESPFWDHQKQILYWVDIIGKKIHIFDIKDQTDNIIKVEDVISLIVPCKTGGAIVAIKNKLGFLDFNNGKIETIHKLDNMPSNVRFNDGKCDAAGRLWVGSMDMNEKEAIGVLYRLDVDLKIKEILDGVTISNGIAWSNDNKKMFYIDSPTRTIKKFNYDIKSGNISNEKVSVLISSEEGVPDGMTIDAEGMLWIAQFYAGKVSRWNPENGNCIEEYKLPTPNITSCCFGGDSLKDLYITTASIRVADNDIEGKKYGGGLFRVKTKTVGVEANYFGI